MSTFNTYAKRLDETAREAFAQLIDAEAKLSEAEQRRRETPMKYGPLIPAEYSARAARIEGDYQTAKAAHEALNRTLPEETLRSVAGIRAELAKAVSDAFAANPADIDHDTLVLLDSGILNADEYDRLLRDSKSPTMRRIIASRAGEAAKAADAAGDRDAAFQLRLVQSKGRADGTAYLQGYDSLVDILSRTLNNHAMIHYWADLTSEVISNF